MKQQTFEGFALFEADGEIFRNSISMDEYTIILHYHQEINEGCTIKPVTVTVTVKIKEDE